MTTTNRAVCTCFALAACLVSTSELLAAPGCDTGNNIDVEATGGTPSAGYPTLAEAFSAINLGTHTGAIVIDVCGNTVEPNAGAILNASGSRASSYENILIKPAGGVARTITGSATPGLPLIDFNGADDVTIDGLNVGGDSLAIVNTTASPTPGTSTIRFINGASGNVVKNAAIQGSFSGSGDGGTIYFATDEIANGNDNDTVSNCDIGPAGANLPAKAIYSRGHTTFPTSLYNSQIAILDNNVHDYFSATGESFGVCLDNGTTESTVNGNRFYQTAPRTQTTGSRHSAIRLSNAQGNANVISGNTIGFANSAGTGTYTVVGSRFSSIYLVVGSSIPTSVQGNRIAGIAMSDSVSGIGGLAPFAGIYVADGKTAVGDVTGNTIGSQSVAGSIVLTSSSNGASAVYGIVHAFAQGVIANNNIGGITAGNSGNGSASIVGISIAGDLALNCLNNTIGGNIADSLRNTATGTNYGITSTAGGTISGNMIRNFTALGGTTGINIDSSHSLTVSQNTIFNLRSTHATQTTKVAGIELRAAGGVVERNRISGLKSATSHVGASTSVDGIRADGSSVDLIVRNNMIAFGEGIENALGATASNSFGSGINGIVLTGSSSLLHNSVYIGGAPTAGTGSSYALNVTTTEPRTVLNNIFVNARSNSGTATGRNYAAKINGTTPNPAGLNLNNNCYLATGVGNVFGFYNWVDVPSIEAWKSAIGQDLASFASDPEFLDPSNAVPDLHIHPVSPTVVEAHGALVGTADDFDGQTRASLTPSDIGADAGDFSPVNLCGAVTCQAPTECTWYACDPADGACKPAYAASTTACGDPDAGICNAADTCDGAGHCIDRKKALNTVCVPASGDCDSDDLCDGVTNNCAPRYQASTVECRASTGSCEPAEFCTGSSDSCPPDTINSSAPVGDSLRVSHDKTTAISTISWNEAAPGPFDVYRGTRSSGAPWTYNQTCYGDNVSAQSITEGDTPPAGNLTYFLVAGDEASCPESGLGPDSSGVSRRNPSPCPSS